MSKTRHVYARTGREFPAASPPRWADSPSVADQGPLGVGTRTRGSRVTTLASVSLQTLTFTRLTVFTETTSSKLRRVPSSRNAIREKESLGPVAAAAGPGQQRPQLATRAQTAETNTKE